MPEPLPEFDALIGKHFRRTFYTAHIPIAFLFERFIPALDGESVKAGNPHFSDREREDAWSRALLLPELPVPLEPIVVASTRKLLFVRAAEDSLVGRLQIPAAAKLVVQTGHSLIAALSEFPDSALTEPLTVQFYHESDPAFILFAARFLNNRGPVSRTAKIHVSNLDPAAEIARALALEAPFIDLTELQKATLAPRSRYLFTLSAIYLATRALLNGRKGEPLESFIPLARDFWQTVAEQFPEWAMVRRGEMTSGELRERYLHAHGVVLHAIGRVGAELLRRKKKVWLASLRALRDIDWRRENSAVWEGRTLIGGKVAKTNATVALTAIYLKQRLGLELTPEEQEKENHHASHSRP